MYNLCMSISEIESSVTCQVFNYCLIHSRWSPPLHSLTCFCGTLLLWWMHYSVKQFLASECWSETPFPVSDSFIQMWQLWGSCLNALPLEVWVDYEIQRDKDSPVPALETDESYVGKVPQTVFNRVFLTKSRLLTQTGWFYFLESSCLLYSILEVTRHRQLMTKRITMTK